MGQRPESVIYTAGQGPGVSRLSHRPLPHSRACPGHWGTSRSSCKVACRRRCSFWSWVGPAAWVPWGAAHSSTAWCTCFCSRADTAAPRSTQGNQRRKILSQMTWRQRTCVKEQLAFQDHPHTPHPDPRPQGQGRQASWLKRKFWKTAGWHF